MFGSVIKSVFLYRYEVHFLILASVQMRKLKNNFVSYKKCHEEDFHIRRRRPKKTIFGLIKSCEFFGY